VRGQRVPQMLQGPLQAGRHTVSLALALTEGASRPARPRLAEKDSEGEPGRQRPEGGTDGNAPVS
jgi:hypothetical protein